MIIRNKNSTIEDGPDAAQPPPTPILSLSFESAREIRGARETLNDLRKCRKQFDRILEQAELEAQRRAALGYEEGFRAGQEAAVIAGLTHLQFQETLLRDLEESLEKIFIALLHQLDNSLNQENLNERIKLALAEIGGQANLHIFLSEKDFLEYQRADFDRTKSLPCTGRLTLSSDQSLAPGEFRLETNGGSLISTRRSLLKMIRSRFLNNPHLGQALQKEVRTLLRSFADAARKDQ